MSKAWSRGVESAYRGQFDTPFPSCPNSAQIWTLFLLLVVVAVRGHLSISLPYLLYSLLSSSTLSTPTPLCAYVHIITKGRQPLSPIVDDRHILKSSTLDFHLRSHLSHLGQASDTLGHIHEILWHPPHHVDLG
jgi:hypothetical protein